MEEVEVLRALFDEAKRQQEKQFNHLDAQIASLADKIERMRDVSQMHEPRIVSLEKWREGMVRQALAWVSLLGGATGFLWWVIDKVAKQ